MEARSKGVRKLKLPEAPCQLTKRISSWKRAASERPNFKQHRVGKTPQRVRMEARSKGVRKLKLPEAPCQLTKRISSWKPTVEPSGGTVGQQPKTTRSPEGGVGKATRRRLAASWTASRASPNEHRSQWVPPSPWNRFDLRELGARTRLRAVCSSSWTAQRETESGTPVTLSVRLDEKPHSDLGLPAHTGGESAKRTEG